MEDLLVDRRSLGSTCNPSSQSRKISIGIMVSPVTRRGTVRPHHEKKESLKAKAHDNSSTPTVFPASCGSPWITPKSGGAKNEKSAQKATRSRYNEPRAKKQAASTSNQGNSVTNIDTQIAKSSGHNVNGDAGNPQMENEFTFATNLEDASKPNEAKRHKVEEQRTETLRVKLHEILGIVRSPRTQPLSDAGKENPNGNTSNLPIGKSLENPTSEPKLPADTIETESESLSLQVKRSNTRPQKKKTTRKVVPVSVPSCRRTRASLRNSVIESVYRKLDAEFSVCANRAPLKDDKKTDQPSASAPAAKSSTSNKENVGVSRSTNSNSNKSNERKQDDSRKSGRRSLRLIQPPVIAHEKEALKKTPICSKQFTNKKSPVPASSRKQTGLEVGNKFRKIMRENAYSTMDGEFRVQMSPSPKKQRPLNNHDPPHVEPSSFMKESSKQNTDDANAKEAQQPQGNDDVLLGHNPSENEMQTPILKTNSPIVSPSPSTPKNSKPSLSPRFDETSSFRSFQLLQKSPNDEIGEQNVSAEENNDKEPCISEDLDFGSFREDSVSTDDDFEKKTGIEDFHCSLEVDNSSDESQDADENRRVNTSKAEVAATISPKFISHLRKRPRGEICNNSDAFTPPTAFFKDAGTPISESFCDTQDDDLRRVVMLLGLALKNFKNKMDSATKKKTSEILISSSEEIKSHLSDVSRQIQSHLGKITTTNKTQMKRLQGHLKDKEDNLAGIHEKFRADINQHLQDCINAFEGFEELSAEMQEALKNHKALHEKLILQAEETINTKLMDIEKKIIRLQKSSREKMLKLQYAISDCLEDDETN